MKKVYDEYFNIPEEEKISEKVIVARAILTIAIIVGCLVTMSVTAYAFFYHDVTSSLRNIRAANFDTNIQIVDIEGNSIDIKSVENNYRYYTASLEKEKSYTVTIMPSSQSTAQKGFVLVGAMACEDTYHTQQLGTDIMVVGGETSEIVFTLAVTDDTDVVFIPHWGTSSYYGYSYENVDYYIANGGSATLIIDGITEELLPTSTPLPEETPLPTTSPLPEETPLPTTSPLPEETTEPTETPLPETTKEPAQTLEPEQTTAPTVESTQAPEESVTPTETQTEETTDTSSLTEAPTIETTIADVPETGTISTE